MNAAGAILAPAPRSAGSEEFGAIPGGIGHRLAAPRQTIERVFLAMGQELVGCTRLLNEISAAHKGIPEELEGEAFDAVASTLASIRNEVLHLSSARTEEGENLARLVAMAQATAAPIHALGKSARTIRLVAVNARIAAASTAGAEGELSVFTTDLMELGQSIERVVAMFAAAHGHFAYALADARRANAAFAERHGTTMAEISGGLSEHLDYIAAYRQRAATAASEHTALTARIRSRVAQAVSALQIGDITRQRLEHVEEALDMLHQRGVEEPSNLSRRRNTLAAAARLLGALLEDARLDFEHEIADLAQSLEELAGDADIALEAGKREAASAFSDGEAALASIIDDLAEIRTLFRDFAETRAGMERIATKVAKAVAVMVDRLGAIAGLEHQIGLLSLNTAIQCGRLGKEARALRVIAQDMREIAGETVAASSTILAAMEQAAELAHVLIEGEAADLACRTASLDGDAARAVDLLGQVSGRLRAHVSTMTATGPQAVRQLRAAASHAISQCSLGAAMRTAQADTLALAPDVADLSALDPEFFAGLRGRYTMDSERQVHDRVLGLQPVPEEVASFSDNDEALDDVFF